MKDFQPKDFIAVLVICSLVLFKLTGHNGSFDVAVAIIIGYYFARRQDTQITVKPDQVEKQ